MTRPLKAILLDLDGTLFFKGAPIAGAAAALDSIAASGMARRFLTNTDSKNRAQMRLELQSIGLDLPAAEIFTAATAALAFLQSQPQNHCFLLLNAALRGDFAPFVGRAADVDYVVVGDLRDAVSYSALNDAFRHLRAGAKLIALQKGRYFVRSDGEYLDTGAFVQLLEYASGRPALVLGKPSPSFFELALAELGCAPEEALVVGDDIATDVAGAHAMGARSVLVRTGKVDPVAVESAAIAPTAIVDSVADLPELLLRLAP